MLLQKPVAHFLPAFKKPDPAHAVFHEFLAAVPTVRSVMPAPVLRDDGLGPQRSEYSSDSACRKGYPGEPQAVEPSPVGLQDFMAVKKLGFGDSGVVYLVKHKLSNKLFAIKKMEKEFLDSDAIEMLLQEQRALLKVRDRAGLLRLEASFHDSECFYHVTQFLAGGDLRGQMSKCGRLRPRHALFYTANLILALEMLHGLGIVHRDLKPENIFIDADGYPVIGDLGMSKHRSFTSRPPSLQDQSGCGVYSAPEIFLGKSYSFEVDFWALGVMLFEMLCGRKPFSDGFDGLRESVLHDPVVFTPRDRVDIHTQIFVFHVLQKDPKDRLSPGAMKRHKYFRGIDWGRLAHREIGAPWTPNTAALKAEIKAAERDNLCFTLDGADPVDPDTFPDYTFQAPSIFVATSTGGVSPLSDSPDSSAVSASPVLMVSSASPGVPPAGLALFGVPDCLSDLHKTLSVPYSAALSVSSPSLATYSDATTPSVGSIASPTTTTWSASTSSTNLYSPSPRVDSPTPSPSHGTALGALTDLRRWMKRFHA